MGLRRLLGVTSDQRKKDTGFHSSRGPRLMCLQEPRVRERCASRGCDTLSKIAPLLRHLCTIPKLIRRRTSVARSSLFGIAGKRVLECGKLLISLAAAMRCVRLDQLAETLRTTPGSQLLAQLGAKSPLIYAAPRPLFSFPRRGTSFRQGRMIVFEADGLQYRTTRARLGASLLCLCRVHYFATVSSFEGLEASV